MYLRDKLSGDLVEVLDTMAMIDPCIEKLEGRFHAGEELQVRRVSPRGSWSFLPVKRYPGAGSTPIIALPHTKI